MAVTYILFATNCWQHSLVTDYSTPAVTVLQLKTTVLQQVDLSNGFSKGFVKILHLKRGSLSMVWNVIIICLPCCRYFSYPWGIIYHQEEQFCSFLHQSVIFLSFVYLFSFTEFSSRNMLHITLLGQSSPLVQHCT